MIQAERTLQSEIMLRLGALAAPIIAIPIPNSVFIPARTEAERRLAGRIISQMKANGQLLPGAPDLVILGQDFSAAIELKRPASRTLLGRLRAGRPSDSQIEFAAQCAQHGVRHVYATSWEEVRGALTEWGRIS